MPNSQHPVHYPSPDRPPRFERGTRVVLEGEDENDKPTKEYGIIIDNYWETFLGHWRCWIAFYGFDGFPKDLSEVKPYVLNYGEIFLKPYLAAGTPETRFHLLMERLEDRFPHPRPYASNEVAEAHYLREIDLLRHQNEAIKIAVDALELYKPNHEPDHIKCLACSMEYDIQKIKTL